jgi:hypothetical protein
MNRRQAIENVGIKALGGTATASDVRVVTAVAAMLGYALSGRTREPKPKPDPHTLPYSPGQVFEQLEKRVADIIQLRPYETRSFGRLGKIMAGIQGLELADLDRVTDWIANGGLTSWPVTVTWAHVVKHYANWVGYARAWESRGGQASAQGPVGSDAWR